MVLVLRLNIKNSGRNFVERTLRSGASPARFSCDKISSCHGAGVEKFGEETPAAVLAASKRAPSYLSSIQS